MSVKVYDTITPASTTFPAVMAEHVNLIREDGTADSIQNLFNNKELGGGGDNSVTLTQEEFDLLSDEEKFNGLYYTYDTKRIYKNGIQYGVNEPIELTMAEFKALKEAGALDEQQEYIITTDENGVLLEASDIGYNGTTSGLSSLSVQEAIDEVNDKIDNIIDDENVNENTVLSSKKTMEEINGVISDTTSSTTSTYSSAKINKKFAPRHFGTDNKTLYLKLQLGAMTTHEPITVTDQYGGQVKILGMYDLSTYKSVKIIRLSYGDWSTHIGTDFTNTSSGDANYKIRRLFYCHDDNNYYLEIRQYSYISVEGAPDATMVTSLPAEESGVTLIPESQFASKDDLTKTNKRVQGATPFSEMFFTESRYKKLTVDLYYGREVTFSVNNLGYEGIISVHSSGDSASACTVKNIGVRGNPQGNISVKWGNFKSLGGSGHYQIDLFVYKINASNTMVIRPRTQQVDGYSKIYTSADFVTSSQTEYEAAEYTATTEYESINDSSTGNAYSTWSSSKIKEYVVENASPTYSGTVIPTTIASGVTITTDWNITSGGSNADNGRLLMLNGTSGTFLIHIKGNLGNTSTLPTPTVVSSISSTQSGTWSTDFELSISSSKLRIKNKSSAVGSWRFV